MIEIDRIAAEKILSELDRTEWIFPGYVICKEQNRPVLLGAGGFSEVYEMVSENNPEKRYALKVIGFSKHVVTSEQFRETIRLQKQIGEQTTYVMRILAAREIAVVLDDELNILNTYEATEERWQEAGLHLQFILMEKLEDIILKDKFRNVSLHRVELYTEEEVLEFASQIGEVIQVAHRNNILHRDIKLENIFWDAEKKCYKLGDFGIAKLTEGGNAETVVYTDGYGAPEIERRLYDHYNATADIYSFGITLYLLLNQLRFPGSDGYHASAVQYDPQFIFPAPSEASENMTRFLRRMCAFRKEDRYQSMSEVLTEIERLRSQNDISAEETEYAGDTETEIDTYKEEKKNSASDGKKTDQSTRAKRKHEKQRNDRVFNIMNAGYFSLLTILLLLGMGGMRYDAAFVMQWQFLLLAVLLFVEAIFLKVGELQISFGMIVLGYIGFLIYTCGLQSVFLLLAACVLSGCATLVAAGSAASGLWILLEYIGAGAVFLRMQTYKLGLIAVIIMVPIMYRFLEDRYCYEKIPDDRMAKKMSAYAIVFPALAIIGAILWGLEYFGIMSVPDAIIQFHLGAVGVVCSVITRVMDKYAFNE